MAEREKESQNAEGRETGEDLRKAGRRDALKKMLAASGVVAASTVPGKWNPAVMQVAAQQGLSPVRPRTTPPPTTTPFLPPRQPSP